jgi:O-antigen ligase
MHPLRGWGLGSFQYIYPYFRKPEIFIILKTHQIEFLHPENYFIHLLFEGGIIYLFSFLIANVLLVRKLFSNKDKGTQVYGVLITIFLFQNLFSETFASFLPYLCYILVVGISLVRIVSQKKDVIVNIRIPRALIFCFTIINLVVSFLAIRILAADIYLQRAIYNSQNINFLQAEKFYKKSIAWNYFNPLAHYLLGNLYLEKGGEEDLYRALSYYTNVENMAGNYLQVYFFKWVIFNRLGDKTFAWQYFQKAFRNDPYIFYHMNQLFDFNNLSR